MHTVQLLEGMLFSLIEIVLPKVTTIWSWCVCQGCRPDFHQDSRKFFRCFLGSTYKVSSFLWGRNSTYIVCIWSHFFIVFLFLRIFSYFCSEKNIFEIWSGVITVPPYPDASSANNLIRSIFLGELNYLHTLHKLQVTTRKFPLTTVKQNLFWQRGGREWILPPI